MHIDSCTRKRVAETMHSNADDDSLLVSLLHRAFSATTCMFHQGQVNFIWSDEKDSVQLNSIFSITISLGLSQMLIK
jgi:hypothetical protein